MLSLTSGVWGNVYGSFCLYKQSAEFCRIPWTLNMSEEGKWDQAKWDQPKTAENRFFVD